MDKNNVYTKTSVAVAVSLALNAPYLSAQELEEIIVTAAKREQTAQEIPYNITVLSGDQ